MKCPKCEIDQKHRDGMVCTSCGYLFVLDPKVDPYISDMAFKTLLDKLSGPDQRYFTYHQLYAAIYLKILRRNRTSSVVSTVVLTILGIIFVFVMAGVIPQATLVTLPLVIFLVIVKVIRSKQSIRRIPISSITSALEKGLRNFPMEHLADGKRFRSGNSHNFQEEILQYAPEQILIVERNDVADMLL